MAAPEAKDEYFDASANARQFITLRFAELTIFVTVTGALVAATFSRIASPADLPVAIALKVLGLSVVVVFWVLEGRTMLYWRHFVSRAAELEAELGFRQYSTRPQEGWLSSHRAIRALLALVAALWLVALIRDAVPA
jgi:hypothetical protein